MPIIDNVLVNKKDIDEPGRVSMLQRMGISDYIEQNIRKNIEEYGDSTWLTDTSTGRSMSYSQLLSSIRSMAGSFWGKGLRPGDMVLIMAANYIEVPLTFFSVWKTGASLACLTDMLLFGSIRNRVQEIRPKFIVLDELSLGRISEDIHDLDFVQEIFIIGKTSGYTSVDDLLMKTETECPEHIDMEDDSIAWLLYSSGTTGVPKGIVHTHRSLIGNIEILKDNQKINGKKFLYNLSMIHAGGMMFALSRFLLHANVYFLSDFSELNLLTAIDSIKPCALNIFPTEIAWICQYPELDKYDVTSIVSISTTGSTIHPTHERQIFDKLPNLLFLINGYGTTETGTVCCKVPADDIGFNKTKAIASHVTGSCGKVAPYCKLKIIDRETGEKLGPGEVGEICFYTPFMMKEYLNMPEQTALFVQDGWCHLGDSGHYDINENIFVTGRYKELIKYRLAHVLPIRIEEQMVAHPAVEDVAVVGLPHDIDGEHPLAFVVRRNGILVTPQELVDFTNERVLDKEKLRGGVRFISKIPRNKVGKIVRHELVKLL